MILALLLLLGSPQAPAKRCGWIANPTPGNWWITDRDGEWLLGAQGGYQAPGMDVIPDLSAREWIRTNGYYGVGCACLTMTVDKRTSRVTRVYSAQQRPLKACRADRRIGER
ncbi:Protein of unknown function [Sphingomonas guangdongensis]|uniref:DUF4087 domain-containing protein n=1 Tax=Sphingomonas guangdongensis TaxID=1141890 RepID=A0A285QAJ3_9SPHN|nr:DUF4087 domain-containing protein [Sphingomonas guangdongensis]SOB78528.1 Protein of unknown function [Sphingomonas guangdongensis]